MASDLTTRYVGDNDPIKLAVSDDGDLRYDLPAATHITVRFIDQIGSSNFSGSGTAIYPPDDGQWNVEYPFAVGDTAAPGTFHIYTTVVSSGATATYGPSTLNILPVA